MSLIEFIILAIALSFEALVVMHGCALKNKIPLTKGMAESVLVALVNAVLLIVGIWIGSKLKFTPSGIDPETSSTGSLLADTDGLVYLGLLILVAVRLLFRSGRKSRQVQPYDISRYSTALLLGVALGINTLIVGLAVGFRPVMSNLWAASVPLFVIMTLMAFLGVMLGRSGKEIRARRYTLFAVLFLLAFALKGAFWG
ncbi:MAG: manganese efflux pump [Bacteroidales bacterium]|nr:manganese efflux pump [Bacteroidales bacterium]